MVWGRPFVSPTRDGARKSEKKFFYVGGTLPLNRRKAAIRLQEETSGVKTRRRGITNFGLFFAARLMQQTPAAFCCGRLYFSRYEPPTKMNRRWIYIIRNGDS